MIEAGFPTPRLQHTFRTDAGDARTDFDWDGTLVGEFDGLQKYGRLLRPGETTRDALIREKRREDALRAQGIMVIRWTGEPSNAASSRICSGRGWTTSPQPDGQSAGYRHPRKHEARDDHVVPGSGSVSISRGRAPR